MDKWIIVVLLVVMLEMVAIAVAWQTYRYTRVVVNSKLLGRWKRIENIGITLLAIYIAGLLTEEFVSLLMIALTCFGLTYGFIAVLHVALCACEGMTWTDLEKEGL